MGIDPVTLAAISFATTAISAGAGYVQQKKAEKQQKASNKAAMQAAENEARLTREDAAERARAEQLEARRVRSQQLALYLKSGVTMDGSPMLLGEETTQQGALNARNITENADSQAKSIILRGKAGQQPVQRADIFGTASTVLGAYKTFKTG